MDDRRSTLEVNGVAYTVLETGPEDGPLALCVHGFPDTAHTWRHLMVDLADAGYRVAAPFMRGYAPTAVPPDASYGVAAWVADASALHEALGGDGDAVIIGHDWGAAVAYGAAAHRPERWRRVVGIAVPPAGALGPGFFDYDQLRRSWYMFFFNNPLADAVVPMGDFAFLERLWRDWSPGYDPTTDMEWVREAMAGDHLAAALGTYRVLWGTAPADPAFAAEQAAMAASPTQPTLYLHGEDDGCIGVQWARAAASTLAAGSETVVLPGAGHWVHLEQTAEVGARILSFLSGESDGRTG
ncbi:MAG TPA: alpha/beta hydrolase [Acidimicrobiales bacterium]|nr:alpha/beta hydrolase [Acidimicrobiales bacterium]